MKICRYILPFLLIISLVGYIPLIRVDSEPYVYPVMPGTEEWAANGKMKNQELLQIPSKKLYAMTTKALLETVLNYPYLGDFMAHNEPLDAYDGINKTFNGFHELMGRPDLAKELVAAYEACEIAAGSDDNKKFFNPVMIEYLMLCKEKASGRFSRIQKRKILRIAGVKAEERAAAGVYSDNSNLYLHYSK